MSVWVLVSRIDSNEHVFSYFYQHAWDHKPTEEELMKVLPPRFWEDFDALVSDGGKTSQKGLKWYELFQVK